jgi:hypothetical protein
MTSSLWWGKKLWARGLIPHQSLVMEAFSKVEFFVLLLYWFSGNRTGWSIV